MTFVNSFAIYCPSFCPHFTYELGLNSHSNILNSFQHNLWLPDEQILIGEAPKKVFQDASQIGLLKKNLFTLEFVPSTKN